MSAQQLMRQIQDASTQVDELEDEKFIVEESGEDVSEIESKLLELKSLVEGLKEEYNSELRNAQNMDLGKWIDEKEEEAQNIHVRVDGINSEWLEAECYASVCKALQFRWAWAKINYEDQRDKALLSPENTDAQAWMETHRDRKEEIEKLWIAAERAYVDACERHTEMNPDVAPPKLYWRSHDAALHDAYQKNEAKKQAARKPNDKLIAVQNDIDKNMTDLFLNALPARAIY